MKLVYLLGVGIVAATLMSGLATVNVNHHLSLPQEFQNSNEITHSFLNFQSDVYLTEEISGHNSTYRKIIQLLQNAGNNQTIVFHLAGYGGDGEVMLELINAIRSTKAHTIMLVEAPVYSAHAYISISGNELRMANLSYLMFHTLSNYGTDCSTQTGTDRTVTNVEHCESFMAAENSLAENLVDSMPYLTHDEKAMILTGHDVYLTKKDIFGRRKNVT